MSTHAAFLRGMNVGGHRLTNPELRSLFEGMGFGDVTVFQASGNVVFDPGDLTGDTALESLIETGLERGLGYAVPVFVRSAAEVSAIAAHQPFDRAAVEASAGKLQVSFLKKAPTPAAGRKALALASDHDLLAIRAGELYWLPSGGVLDSELDHKALGGLLGVTTQRTKGTVERLVKKFFS
jgi:uncharacterized protein (DUF1697 family)